MVFPFFVVKVRANLSFNPNRWRGRLAQAFKLIFVLPSRELCLE